MSIHAREYAFTLPFTVRDYECDMEGIVNNAVYQNYLEHARHQFLLSRGIDFAEITRGGVHPVVVRAEIDYRSPLRSGDLFWVGVNASRLSRLKFAFLQDIYRGTVEEYEATDGGLPPGMLVLEATIIAAAVSSGGRPIPPEEMHPGMADLVGL